MYMCMRVNYISILHTHTHVHIATPYVLRLRWNARVVIDVGRYTRGVFSLILNLSDLDPFDFLLRFTLILWFVWGLGCCCVVLCCVVLCCVVLCQRGGRYNVGNYLFILVNFFIRESVE